MILIDAIRNGLMRNPAAPAFIFRDRVIAAASFFGLYCEVVRRLRDEGVAPGEVVGVSLDQSPLHCAVLMALARLGAVSMPLHPGTSPEQRGRLAKRFDSKRAVCGPKVSGPAGCTSIRLERLTFRDDDEDSTLTDFVADEATPARIAFTSGTTGEPSAILYSQGYWFRRIQRTVDGITERSRVIPVDLHLTLGNLFAFGALCAGGTVVFPRGHNVKDLISAINLHAATHVLLPPGTVSAMVPYLPRTGIAFPTLEHMRIIGSRVPEAMLDTLRTRFSPNVSVPYGISEIGAITMASPAMLDEYPECSGVARPGVRIEVVDAGGKPLPEGTSGAIRVAMDEMPNGYFRDERRSAEKFRDGWFYTGDIGRLDTQGRIFIEGREDDRLNVGGRKFDPGIVETVLTCCPGVREAAVFSLENANGSTSVAAAVVCDSPEVVKALPQFCQARGIGALTPRHFFGVDDLPRNPAGKVLRSLLPELFSARRSEDSHGN